MYSHSTNTSQKCINVLFDSSSAPDYIITKVATKREISPFAVSKNIYLLSLLRPIKFWAKCTNLPPNFLSIHSVFPI